MRTTRVVRSVAGLISFVGWMRLSGNVGHVPVSDMWVEDEVTNRDGSIVFRVAHDRAKDMRIWTGEAKRK
jgi:hypothetical protein